MERSGVFLMSCGWRFNRYCPVRRNVVRMGVLRYLSGRFRDGILYVLRTGCQWKALPSEYGSGFTCHRRFQEWVRIGVFQKLWIKLLEQYDEIRGIEWE